MAPRLASAAANRSKQTARARPKGSLRLLCAEFVRYVPEVDVRKSCRDKIFMIPDFFSRLVSDRFWGMDYYCG